MKYPDGEQPTPERLSLRECEKLLFKANEELIIRIPCKPDYEDSICRKWWNGRSWTVQYKWLEKE